MNAGETERWYQLSDADVARRLEVDPARGLSAAEAQARLQKYGPNQLAGKKKESGWQAFLRQYRDFMQIILLAAAAINFVFTRDVRTSVMLVVLTVANAVMELDLKDSPVFVFRNSKNKHVNIVYRRNDGNIGWIDSSAVAASN